MRCFHSWSIGRPARVQGRCNKRRFSELARVVVLMRLCYRLSAFDGAARLRWQSAGIEGIDTPVERFHPCAEGFTVIFPTQQTANCAILVGITLARFHIGLCHSTVANARSGRRESLLI